MPNPAYDKALKLLARRDHFRAELAEKLRTRGFSDGDIEAALDRLAGLGLLDDERLAGRFAELRAVDRGWGPRRLELELRKRGVDRHLAERAARLGDELHRRALATAVRKVAARAPDGWWRLFQRRERLISSLTGRGFDVDEAIAAVGALAAELESDADETHDELGDPGQLP
ncbi:MAG TPA: regulatory protein RecX [Methylomirabilota bacterium]|nr:regulatory protein RecX [Methylomirabilota bacterium]